MRKIIPLLDEGTIGTLPYPVRFSWKNSGSFFLEK
jgi:hypothetical protein